MSENQTVELKKEDRDLLRSTIKELQDAKNPPAESKHDEAGAGSESASEGKGGGQASTHSHRESIPFSHETHASLKELLACPNCYPKVRDSVKAKEQERTKDAKALCVNCGQNVLETDEECFWCGGKEAKKKEG